VKLDASVARDRLVTRALGDGVRVAVNSAVAGEKQNILMDNQEIRLRRGICQAAMLGGVPLRTAWRVLGLRMEERPPAMEVSCEFIE
jgi:hypothetical protein